MAKKTLAAVAAHVRDISDKEKDSAPFILLERELTEDCVFHATDEVGRKGWWFRIEMTGLYPRRVGPFASQEEASNQIEKFIDEVVMDALCDLGNTLHDGRVCVVEGRPRLSASVQEG